MANVTFSSPVMPRDITVYAVAGSRVTLLSLAKTHKIPIPCDCGDGECGSCVVEVKNYTRSTRDGVTLTDKEREVLLQMGKLTKEELKDIAVHDLPPRHRLACQCFVRNEDILVSFEGDTTLPVKGPALSLSAAIYKGGVEMKTLDTFLSYAVMLEEDSAVHYEELSANMEACGNTDVAALFKQLGKYSRMHLAEAKAKCARYDATLTLPASSAWPDNVSPEIVKQWAGDADMTRLDALKVALQGERRGYEFYYSVANTTADKEIRAVAKEFVREEFEHVETLKLWIDKEEAAVRAKAR
ncbi:MAG: 2Fe-2S iron-sulfur cluster binding domain-containing protein [Uliginosibacterium sp.]|jgi:rubrerythrin/ferredoxin|nr:2Fe-2S iron-sulfur cluster binding domain-containing protein [Uliginosibacterium sp.]MBK9395337.1 2Fe-2S iron-sulfur cluster binding domain-containing protein [Uliginosibacterium sp.]MBK9614259.1 2Fe-2S iron-sulfur cluster binding domain-containing protein [Uliginosibacterium sp.]